MKIEIKTNDNMLSIAQPYFADATIFSQKTTDFSKQAFNNSIIVFAYAIMFSRLMLASFTIHIGFTLEKVYSVQL